MDKMEEKGMSDTEKSIAEASTEEREVVSRNFIEQLIDRDLEEGVYPCQLWDCEGVRRKV